MTGRCGTELGYRDHVVDRTPKCAPCRRAHADERADRRRRTYLYGPHMSDVTGTVRRLQALAAIGWSLREVGRRLGISPQTLRGLMCQERCTTATRDKVAALYDELSMIVGGNPRTVTWAAKRGFAPPLAWDDIDDPAATPATADDTDDVDELAVDAVLDGHRLSLSGATAHAAVHALADRGYPPPLIALRCGLSERQVHRLKARDTAPRHKTNRPASTSADLYEEAS